jgi:hypothetical protein
MTYQELEAFANEVIKQHPNHSDKVEELLELCIDEIQEGASEQNEIDLCWNDINYLINTKK